MGGDDHRQDDGVSAMRQKQIQRAAALLLAALLASLAACSGREGPDIARNGRVSLAVEDPVTFQMLYASEVETLNYLVSYSSVDTELSANLIDTLVDCDSYGQILPGLAESWESNREMTEWTFHIRRDANWYDWEGNVYAPVTADDWVATAQYVNNAANGSGVQYLYSTGAVVEKAQDYFNYTNYLQHPNDYEAAPRKVEASEIGVCAKDRHTLVVTLDQPCPFFLSVLSYSSYLPVNRSFLEAQGDAFGTGKEHLLYNGAFILTEFEPMERHVLTRNPDYWDAGSVHLDEIEQQYDADAPHTAVRRYLAGEIDYAHVDAERLAQAFADPAAAAEIHQERADTFWSYFYTFNFEPQFDEEYEPENWKKAVANEEFRKALQLGLDSLNALRAYNPEEPESLQHHTLTPPGALSLDGTDFTEYGPLEGVSARVSYDPERALMYRDIARGELEPEGVSFPVKVLMPYNPATVGWQNECRAVEAQMEELLGRDFIDIIVVEGPETGFLTEVRSSGKFAFMKCRWGADYADPQTWAEPFRSDSNYCFWERSENRSVNMHYEAWASKVSMASGLYDSMENRYWFFADAENLLLEHAIFVPFSIESDSFIMSRLNVFEGEYAPYGLVNQRYKGYCLHESSMNREEYAAAYAQWQEEREARLSGGAGSRG